VERDVLGRYHDGVTATFRAPAATSADALSFLAGRWLVERRVADHAAAAAGTFRGTAEWTAAGDRVLAYHEQGELEFRGHRGPASRDLIYQGRPDGTADVLFADGRAFYHLDPRPGHWTARHDCGQDVYELTAWLLGPESFTERWRVAGPGKDYEIMTRLVKTSGGAGQDGRP